MSHSHKVIALTPALSSICKGNHPGMIDMVTFQPMIKARILPCEHTFSEETVERLIKELGSKCPLDRTEFQSSTRNRAVEEFWESHGPTCTSESMPDYVWPNMSKDTHAFIVEKLKSAKTEFSNGNFEKAVQEFGLVLTKIPDNPQVNYNLFCAKLATGEVDLVAINKAVAYDTPDRAQFLETRTRVLKENHLLPQ